jgi:ATP-dependent DNA helicase RecQ
MRCGCGGGGVAQSQGVPAYVVADDRTLGGIAAARPDSVEALLDVPGMGAVARGTLWR